MNLHEQLRIFSDASDGIRKDIPPEELAELTKNIKEHIDDILNYLDIIDADAELLRAKARKISEAAKQQENKSTRIRDYLKFALKSQGFTKFATAEHKINLSTTSKPIPRRPAGKEDAWQYPDLVKTRLNWVGEPTFAMAEERPDLVDLSFDWDVDALKKSGKDELIDYQIIDRLTVGVAKK